MKQKDKNFVVALDINTSSIKSVLGRVNVSKKEKNPFFELHGVNTKCEGMGPIGITNKKYFSKSLENAIESLKNSTGFDVENAHLLYTHPSLQYFRKTRKMINVEDPNGIHITQKWLDDQKKNIEDKIAENYIHKKCVSLKIVSIIADGEEIVHDPQDFNVFNQIKIEFVYVLVQETFLESIQDSAENLISVDNMYPAILSNANLLTEEEKNEGIIICNIGSLYTSIAAYKNGFLQHLSVIEFGEYDIIKQIIIMEKVSMLKAREIKDSIDSKNPIFTKTKIKSLNAKISADIKKTLLPTFKNINLKKEYLHGVLLTGDIALHPEMDSLLKKTLNLHVSVDKSNIHIQTKNPSHYSIWSAAYGYLYGAVKNEYNEFDNISSKKSGLLNIIINGINNFSRSFH